MKAHLRRVHNDYHLPFQIPAGWVLISLTNHLGGSISRRLEASTSFALPFVEVMNEVNHLVLLFFLFATKGAAGYWGNPRDKIFHLAPGALCRPGTRLPFLDAWGAGRESFFMKGRRSRRLPLSTFLNAYGAGPESSLAKEGCSGRRLITSSQPTTSVSEVWAGVELPRAKFRRSAIT